MKIENYLIDKKIFTNGFGLVDSIISISLLGIVVSYSIYFVTKRLDILYGANIYRSINKEIKRDIDLLKSDLWSMGLNKDEKKYVIESNYCIDLTENILNLPNWKINESIPNAKAPIAPSSGDKKIQYWWPDETRGKIFKGRNVLIIRELVVKSFNGNSNLDRNISNISYRVKFNDNNLHWLSIDLGSEAHSWCF